MWQDVTTGEWTVTFDTNDHGDIDQTYDQMPEGYEYVKWIRAQMSETWRIIRSAREYLAVLREAALERCYDAVLFIVHEPEPEPLWWPYHRVRYIPRQTREPGLGIRNFRKSV
jgi:hypothetical protein